MVQVSPKGNKVRPPAAAGCPSGETRKIKELPPSSWRQGTGHRTVPFRWFESRHRKQNPTPPLLRGCPSGETRKIKELPPSSWRQGTVHRTVPFGWFESRHRKQNPTPPRSAGGVGFWSEWRDSNSRHPGPKPGALPTGPHPEIKMYYTRYLGKKQVPIWASILSEGKCQPPTGWLGAGVAIGRKFRRSPGPAWLRPPSGNRRCWHRLHSCLPCRTAWRRHPGCGRC